MGKSGFFPDSFLAAHPVIVPDDTNSEPIGRFLSTPSFLWAWNPPIGMKIRPSRRVYGQAETEAAISRKWLVVLVSPRGI